MKVINLDRLVSEKAKIVFLEKEYELKECTLYEWAEYNGKVEALDEDDQEKMIEFYKWAINVVIPDLDVNALDFTHLKMVLDISMVVFNGGIKELGKKTKPLHEIMETM